MEAAKLVDTEAGMVPDGEGWFVVNVREAAWISQKGLGSATVFESRAHEFAEVGINIQVLHPGEPNGMYHAETQQEDFLVLQGECIAIVEDQERPMRAWDFLHCPAGTRHIFVGAGDGPCAILMVGARKPGHDIVYPRSEIALKHGAGVERETHSPKEAYAAYPDEQPGRPEDWERLPWGR